MGETNALAPLASVDGKKVFFIGEQRRGELVRYEEKSGQFLPYLSGTSADLVAFSSDGKWATYVAYPEGTLWRSRIDGSEQRQLTFAPMQAGSSRWSPDGKEIVFGATGPGKSWKIYRIWVNGGAPQQLVPGEESESSPDWSPDGQLIVYAYGRQVVVGAAPAVTGQGLRMLDPKTGQISTVPGSEGYQSPRWSPDGHHIAAMFGMGGSVAVFDVRTRKWTDLASGVFGKPNWSADGGYIYFDGGPGSESLLFRLRISDRKLERLVNLKGFRRAWGFWGPWMGVSPDGSCLLLRDIGSQEVYALDWEAP